MIHASINIGIKHGIKGISTKLVAKAVGITEPTVYAHFETRENLAAEAFSEAWCQFPHQIVMPLNNSKEAIESALSSFLELVRESSYSWKQVKYVGLYLDENPKRENVTAALSSSVEEAKRILSSYGNYEEGSIEKAARSLVISLFELLNKSINGNLVNDIEEISFNYLVLANGFLGYRA